MSSFLSKKHDIKCEQVGLLLHFHDFGLVVPVIRAYSCSFAAK